MATKRGNVLGIVAFAIPIFNRLGLQQLIQHNGSNITEGKMRYADTLAAETVSVEFVEYKKQTILGQHCLYL